jgi:hypothetical protein
VLLAQYAISDDLSSVKESEGITKKTKVKTSKVNSYVVLNVQSLGY